MKIGQAVQRRCEPLTRAQHFPRYADVTTFVGQGQCTHTESGHKPDEDQYRYRRVLVRGEQVADLRGK